VPGGGNVRGGGVRVGTGGGESGGGKGVAVLGGTLGVSSGMGSVNNSELDCSGSWTSDEM